MRVLHVNTERTWRGGERQTLLTLLGLRKKDVWVGLVAQPDSAIIKAAEAEEIPTFPLPMNGPADVIAAWRLGRRFRRAKADIVHLQTSHAASLGLMARGFGKEPPLVASRRVDFPIKTAWKYNSFDAILPISDAIKKILIDCGIEEQLLHKVPSGVHTDVASPENLDSHRIELAGEASPLIGCIGHLAEHKGHRYLLEALPRILEKFPNAKLAIIGDGELRQDLEERTKFLEIQDNVVFTGFREDAADLIYALDLYVHPSRLEGLASTLLDVLLRGVPVVASNTGGIPEALCGGKFGVLVPPEDPTTLANAIIEVLESQDRRNEIINGAAEFIREEFSVEIMVERTLTVYKRLLEKKNIQV